MRRTSLLWLFSSLLLANALPVPLDSSGLANDGESHTFKVDPANVDRRRRHFDKVELEKRVTTNTPAVSTKATPSATVNKPASATVNEPASATVNKPASATVNKPISSPTNTKVTTNSTTTSPGPGTGTGTVKACSIKNSPPGVSLRKRAPGHWSEETAPEIISIEVGEDLFHLDLVPLTESKQRGVPGIVYHVQDTDIYAKTYTATEDSLELEIELYRQSGLLVTNGPDTNNCNEIHAEWMVIRNYPGKLSNFDKNQDNPEYKARKLQANQNDKAIEDLNERIKQTSDLTEKEELKATVGKHYRESAPLIQDAAEWLFLANNMDSRNNQVILHGLTDSEALLYAEQALKAAIISKKEVLRLLPGQGIGLNERYSRLKPTIDRLLTKYRLRASPSPNEWFVTLLAPEGSNRGRGGSSRGRGGPSRGRGRSRPAPVGSAPAPVGSAPAA